MADEEYGRNLDILNQAHRDAYAIFLPYQYNWPDEEYSRTSSVYLQAAATEAKYRYEHRHALYDYWISWTN